MSADIADLLNRSSRIIEQYAAADRAKAPLGLTSSDGVTRTVTLASEAERDALMAFMTELRGEPRSIDLRFANGERKLTRVGSQADRDAILAFIAEAQMRPAAAFFQLNGQIKGINFATARDRDAMLAWCSEPRATGPTAVEVVSMPDRKTDTTVSRDSNGNIVKTTQVERDG